MLNRSEKIRLVTKLHKLTLDRKLQWSYVASPDLSKDKEISSEMYETEWNGVKFHVYRMTAFRYPSKVPDIYSGLAAAFPEMQRLTDRYILDVYDAENGLNTDSITDFDGVTPVRDLMSAVRSTITTVDEKLKALIGESQPEAVTPSN